MNRFGLLSINECSLLTECANTAIKAYITYTYCGLTRYPLERPSRLVEELRKLRYWGEQGERGGTAQCVIECSTKDGASHNGVADSPFGKMILQSTFIAIEAFDH
jgi:hypothetical protein